MDGFSGGVEGCAGRVLILSWRGGRREGKRGNREGSGTILVGECRLRRGFLGLDRWLDPRGRGGLKERRIRAEVLVEVGWWRWTLAS